VHRKSLCRLSWAAQGWDLLPWRRILTGWEVDGEGADSSCVSALGQKPGLGQGSPFSILHPPRYGSVTAVPVGVSKQEPTSWLHSTTFYQEAFLPLACPRCPRTSCRIPPTPPPPSPRVSVQSVPPLPLIPSFLMIVCPLSCGQTVKIKILSCAPDLERGHRAPRWGRHLLCTNLEPNFSNYREHRTS
jgi:hypothetical protein